MDSLRPGSSFNIVWQISDPLDSTTYYPQVVIYDSVKNLVLDTVNLTLDSSGRYSALWQVPQDSYNLGLQIDMTVRIYTDSGHTTVSPNYQIENRIYKIKNETQNFGGSGDYTDYRHIAKLIKEEVALVSLSFVPLIDEMREVKARVLSLETKVSNIKPATLIQDLSAVTKELLAVKTDLNNEMDKLHAYVMEGLQNLADTQGKTQETVKTVVKTFNQFHLQEMTDTIERVEFMLKERDKTVFIEPEKVEIEKVDINKEKAERIVYGSSNNKYKNLANLLAS
jgi:hypothetical protein